MLSPAGLMLVVLDKIADEHICIDPDHFRLRGSGNPGGALGDRGLHVLDRRLAPLLFRSP